MKPVIERSSGAAYQKLFRQRMTEMGLVRKDAWILPEHALVLSAVAKALQKPGTRILIEEGQLTMAQKIENAQALRDALVDQFKGKPIDIALVDGIDPVLELRLNDHGGLPIVVAIAGEVIIAQAFLWPESLVRDTATFNRQVMLSEKLFGLANISLDRAADGETNYVAYGALRAQSTPEDIAYEIEALAHSVLDIAETFRPYLKA
jgi:uncharacterized protein YjfI (DUF2170 family)